MRRLLLAPLLGLSLVVSASPSRAADPPISEQARVHFQAGVNLLKDPDGARYEDAYREFKAAYADSQLYKILGNLALCAMKLERDGEAIEAYQKYLERAGELDPAEVSQVKTDLATLSAGLVTLTLNVDTPGASITDTRLPTRGEKIMNLYGPTSAVRQLKIGMRAGHHMIIVKLTGYDDYSWEFDAATGAILEKDIVLKRVGGAATGTTGPSAEPEPDRQKRGLPGAFYVGLAATGVLAAGSAVVGVMALSKKSDFKDKNNGSDPQGARDIKSSGKTLNLVTDILLGGTVVAAGITTFFLVTRNGGPEKIGVSVVPAVASHGAGVYVTGPLF
jgi:hypothetical protein